MFNWKVLQFQLVLCSLVILLYSSVFIWDLACSVRSSHMAGSRFCYFTWLFLWLQTTCSHAVLPLHPPLRSGSVLSAVHLGHGASPRTPHQCRHHESEAVRTGQGPVPLPETWSNGKI